MIDFDRRYVWAPFPGKQTDFLSASEDDVFFGGAKGPGKSDCILMGATRQVHMERYKALILRESFPELQELIERSALYFPQLRPQPVWNGDLKRWRFPNLRTKTGAGGGSVQFGYCGKVDDVARYQGQEWAYIGFDEMGKLKEERVLNLLEAEIRCPNPDVVWMLRSAGNPGQSGHGWIKRRYITPCGKEGHRIVVTRVTIPGVGTREIRRRFVPAWVKDNPVYANSPRYMAFLLTLPKALKQQLLFGDWDVGIGLALDELNRGAHIVPEFRPPQHWTLFASFDWGYAHNWAYCLWCCDEDGRCWVIDTIWGRRQKVHEIAKRIKDLSPAWAQPDAMMYISAGHDCWAKDRSRTDMTPTIAEEFEDHGILLHQANIDRRMGLQNARHYLAYQGLLEGFEGDEIDDDPWCRFMDTHGNERLFQQLQSMVTDEDDPEEVLKVHADPLTGEGGDDGYDCFRYGLASRPPRPIGIFRPQIVSAWSQAVLRYEYESTRRDRDPTPVGAAQVIG